MLFGKIKSDEVTEEFDFVEKDTVVYPTLSSVLDVKEEGDSIFACMAMPQQVAPPNVVSPEGSSQYALLAIPKAKAIIIDKETRGKQSFEKRVVFMRMLLGMLDKQTEAFMNEGIALTFEPFVNPFSMNSFFAVINSVAEDMADKLGVEVQIPEIKVQIQKKTPVLTPDGNVAGGGDPKIIC